MPPAPEGLKHLWMNGDQWCSLCEVDGFLLVYYWDDNKWAPGCDYSRAHAELANLAKENADLNTQNKALLEDLEYAIDWLEGSDNSPGVSFMNRVKALIAKCRGEEKA